MKTQTWKKEKPKFICDWEVCANIAEEWFAVNKLNHVSSSGQREGCAIYTILSYVYILLASSEFWFFFRSRVDVCLALWLYVLIEWCGFTHAALSLSLSWPCSFQTSSFCFLCWINISPLAWRSNARDGFFFSRPSAVRRRRCLSRIHNVENEKRKYIL